MEVLQDHMGLGPRYRIESVGSGLSIEHLEPGRGNAWAVFQVGTEGYWLFVAKHIGLSAYRYDEGSKAQVWGSSLDGPFLPERFGSPCAYLGGGFDGDGDGDVDLAALARTEDLQRWRVFLHDARSGERWASHELPVGPDRNGSGAWDGIYSFVTAIESEEDSTRRDLVLVRDVGRDALDRGLYVVDCVTGKMRWQYRVATAVRLHHVAVHDLDGDTRPDFVLGGASVDNLRGQQVGGLSDDELYVHAVNADGELLWRSRIGGVTVSAKPVVLGTADGASRLLVGVQYGGRGQDLIRVIDPSTGTASRPIYQFAGRGKISAVLRRDEQDDLLVAISSTGEARVLGWRDNGLVELASAEVEGWPATAVVRELAPESKGPEILIQMPNGRLELRNAGLELLASHRFEGQTFPRQPPFVIPRQEEAPLLILPGIETGEVEVVQTSPSFFGWALVIVVAGIGIRMVVLRRDRNLGIPPPRLARRQLLDTLELASHGSIGALQNLRLLTWHIRTLSAGIGRDEEVMTRMTALAREVCDHDLQRLQEELTLLEHADIAPSDAKAIEERIHELEVALKDLVQDGWSEKILRRTEVIHIAQRLERELQEVRRVLESKFSCSLTSGLDRVLESWRLQIEEMQVIVEVPEADVPAVRMDEADLIFILDNLVANALRAMRSATTRRVTVRWREDSGLVILDIGDSGHGIPQDDWERILDSRYTTRKQGGAGLVQSRRLLKRHGGRIQVLESGDDIGTTFRIELPAALAEVECGPESIRT